MRPSVTLFAVLLACNLCAGPVGAAGWGDLTGTFLYDGTAPAPEPLEVTRDQAFCGKHKLVNEGLVVGPNGGVKNIVVYLYPKRGASPPPVHPDYEKSASAKVKLDNKGCRFEPHVVLLRTSQTLVLGNSDPIGHNTKIDCFINPGINPLIPAGGHQEHKFSLPERVPVPVGCNIHPWMSAHVVIKDNPYFAVTDDHGKFTIKNLPAGTWTFQFWHERAGYIQEVNLNGKDTKWRRGRVQITIRDGETTDLGAIKVAPGIFKVE